MKKFFAILLSAMLMLSLAVPASAASITIDGGASGSEYAAYKLLNATDGGDDKFAYTLNEKYTSILQNITGTTTQADIVAYIAALDDERIRTFANAVYAAIGAADPAISADYHSVDAAIENDAANVFENVDQGYYLIVETALGTTGENYGSDTYSLVMLDTAGNDAVTVTTKEDVPTVEKKVEEKNDSTTDDPTWGDSADYDVGDEIDYKITGTVSAKYAEYKSYYYSFSDTMDDGLTLDQDSITIMIGDVDVTSQFDIDTTEHSFTATTNLKELDAARDDVTITDTTKIIVTYTATLNENAVSGSTGNKNEVILKYENDPYHEGDGNPDTPDEPDEPGKTPEDVNIVFTYDVIVNKTDGTNPLTGAGFTLYKWDASIEGEDKWDAVSDEVKGDALTTFEFKKLDEGKYKLVETTVPAGYNKAADVEFEIISTLTEGENPELKALVVDPSANFTVTLSSGSIATTVVNNAGTELPSTGGIGTTIFYALGAALMIGAGVLLVTKKRMGE